MSSCGVSAILVEISPGILSLGRPLANAKIGRHHSRNSEIDEFSFGWKKSGLLDSKHDVVTGDGERIK